MAKHKSKFQKVQLDKAREPKVIEGPKIIKEFVETKFEEVPSQKISIAEDYGDDKEEEEENISFAKERVAPTIQTGTDEERLENIAERESPKTPVREETGPNPDYVSVYNMPKYAEGGGEERVEANVRRMRETGLISTGFEQAPREFRRTERMEEWHELQSVRREANRDQVVSAGRLDDNNSGLPFERKYKRKTIQ